MLTSILIFLLGIIYSYYRYTNSLKRSQQEAEMGVAERINMLHEKIKIKKFIKENASPKQKILRRRFSKSLVLADIDTEDDHQTNRSDTSMNHFKNLQQTSFSKSVNNLSFSSNNSNESPTKVYSPYRVQMIYDFVYKKRKTNLSRKIAILSPLSESTKSLITADSAVDEESIDETEHSETFHMMDESDVEETLFEGENDLTKEDNDDPFIFQIDIFLLSLFTKEFPLISCGYTLHFILWSLKYWNQNDGPIFMHISFILHIYMIIEGLFCALHYYTRYFIWNQTTILQALLPSSRQQFDNATDRDDHFAHFMEDVYCTHDGIKHYLESWLTGMDNWEDIHRDNVLELISLQIFRARLYDLSEREYKDCEFYLSTIEKMLKYKFEKGMNESIKIIAPVYLTPDDVAERMNRYASNFPLIWYFIVRCIRFCFEIQLRWLGFYKFDMNNGCYAWIHHNNQNIMDACFDFENSVNNAMNSSPYLRSKSHDSLPNEYDGVTHKDENLVFLHGIGIGYYGYMNMIKQLVARKKYKNIVMLYMPWVSMVPNSIQPSAEDLIKGIAKTLYIHDIKKAHFLSHSYGTMVFGGLCTLYPSLVERATVIDPVAFFSNLSHGCYNCLFPHPNSFRQFVFQEFSIFSTFSSFYNDYIMILNPMNFPSGTSITLLCHQLDSFIPIDKLKRRIDSFQGLLHNKKTKVHFMSIANKEHANIFFGSDKDIEFIVNLVCQTAQETCHSVNAIQHLFEENKSAVISGVELNDCYCAHH